MTLWTYTNLTDVANHACVPMHRWRLHAAWRPPSQSSFCFFVGCFIVALVARVFEKPPQKCATKGCHYNASRPSVYCGKHKSGLTSS